MLVVTFHNRVLLKVQTLLAVVAVAMVLLVVTEDYRQGDREALLGQEQTGLV